MLFFFLGLLFITAKVQGQAPTFQNQEYCSTFGSISPSTFNQITVGTMQNNIVQTTCGNIFKTSVIGYEEILIQLTISFKTTQFPPLLIVTDASNGLPTMSYDSNGYLNLTNGNGIIDLQDLFLYSNYLYIRLSQSDTWDFNISNITDIYIGIFQYSNSSSDFTLGSISYSLSVFGSIISIFHICPFECSLNGLCFNDGCHCSSNFIEDYCFTEYTVVDSYPLTAQFTPFSSFITQFYTNASLVISLNNNPLSTQTANLSIVAYPILSNFYNYTPPTFIPPPLNFTVKLNQSSNSTTLELNHGMEYYAHWNYYSEFGSAVIITNNNPTRVSLTLSNIDPSTDNNNDDDDSGLHSIGLAIIIIIVVIVVSVILLIGAITGAIIYYARKKSRVRRISHPSQQLVIMNGIPPDTQGQYPVINYQQIIQNGIPCLPQGGYVINPNQLQQQPSSIPIYEAVAITGPTNQIQIKQASVD